MRVALDVMGGDFGPSVIVRGALKALRELEGAPEIVLYGDREKVASVLRAEGEAANRFELVHTTETITMTDAPARAVRQKKDTPVARGMMDLKAGEVQGVVSAGSTGAMVAAALIYVGRLPKVLRPAIATWFPGEGGGSVMLDVGANSDNKPEHLAQFGVMGSLFAEAAIGVDKPRVGLLNIGEESSKGSELYVQAHELMKKMPVNFVGNIEGQDILRGKADVIVCDGFVGNVVLKLAESMVGYLTGRIKKNVLSSIQGKMGVLLMRSGLRQVRQELYYAEHGGAPLLGVAGTVIISHGKSNELAIMNAIRTAARFQETRAVERTEELLGGGEG